MVLVCVVPNKSVLLLPLPGAAGSKQNPSGSEVSGILLPPASVSVAGNILPPF